MRLLIVGTLEGQLSEATKMAMNGGAKVAHAPSVEIALAALRAGRGADLLLVDVMMDLSACFVLHTTAMEEKKKRKRSLFVTFAGLGSMLVELSLSGLTTLVIYRAELARRGERVSATPSS